MAKLRELGLRGPKGRGIIFAGLFFVGLVGNALAQSDWKREWDKTLAEAEKEGQVTIYGPPGVHYQNAVNSFSAAHPKIKLVYVPGSGSSNAQRLVAERTAGKYLGDVFVGGSGTMVLVLFKGAILDPLPPALILPENSDQSLWFTNKHLYADPKGQYVFIMQGNAQSHIGAYNTKLVNPDEIKSYWDVLHPKWKGKMVAYDPKARGHIQTIRGVYYNPILGPEFVRRLFGEMDLTISRDQRLILDWVAQGKFHISIFSTRNDIVDASKKGLPLGVLEVSPAEGHISGGFGHVSLINKAPHPGAAKVFVNWLLSKEGQIEWQKKTDNNSLRTDIPKEMLSDPRLVPKEGGKYLISSLPQYENVKPLLKIVNEALAKSRKK